MTSNLSGVVKCLPDWAHCPALVGDRIAADSVFGGFMAIRGSARTYESYPNRSRSGNTERCIVHY